jgi:hypothetical protein
MGRSVKAGPTHIDKDGTRTYCGITRERIMKSFRSGRGHIAVISRADAADPRSFGFMLCPKCKELAGPGIRGGGDIGNVIARTLGGKKRHGGVKARTGRQKCVHCDLPSIPGMKKGQGLCQKHWDQFAYGQKFTDRDAELLAESKKLAALLLKK